MSIAGYRVSWYSLSTFRGALPLLSLGLWHTNVRQPLANYYSSCRTDNFLLGRSMLRTVPIRPLRLGFAFAQNSPAFSPSHLGFGVTRWVQVQLCVHFYTPPGLDIGNFSQSYSTPIPTLRLACTSIDQEGLYRNPDRSPFSNVRHLVTSPLPGWANGLGQFEAYRR